MTNQHSGRAAFNSHLINIAPEEVSWHDSVLVCRCENLFVGGPFHTKAMRSAALMRIALQPSWLITQREVLVVSILFLERKPKQVSQSFGHFAEILSAAF